MKFNKFCMILLACSVTLSAEATWFGSNALVERTSKISAQELDSSLPNQPLDGWILKHLPQKYELVWRDKVSNCDEPNSNLQCVEVEIKQGRTSKGLLAFLVATEKEGELAQGKGLYHGRVEYLNIDHQFRKLSDLRQLNVERPQ